MEKERSRRRSRRKPSLKAAGFLYRQGRRWCAVFLSVCMIISNMAGTVFAAEGEEGRDYLFKLTRSALYEALQAAVLEGSPLDAEFIFRGDEKITEEYEKLLAMNDDLYELKPEIKNNHGALTLRILASLDWGTEEGKEYRIVGNEKFIFLLTNHAETEQKAVIQVDNQRSEIIIVAPKQDFNLTEENLPGNENPEESPEGAEGTEEVVPEGSEAQEAGNVISGGFGGSGGGAGGGSGSGSGSGAGSSIEEGKESIEEGTGSGEVTEAGNENEAGTEIEAGEEPENGAGTETGTGSETGTGKENGEGTEAGTGSETGTKAAEDTGAGGREENSEVSDKEDGNRENGSGQGNEAEKETGAKTDTDVKTDTKTDTDTEIKDNTKTEKDTDTKTEENTGTKTENNTDKTETGNTGSQEKEESSNQENSGSSEKADSKDKSGESGNSSSGEKSGESGNGDGGEKSSGSGNGDSGEKSGSSGNGDSGEKSGESGNSGSKEKSGESGNKDSGDSGNGGSSKENHNDEKKDTSLSISSKNVQMVAASLEESEVTLFNASPSNASPSDASSSNAEEKMLEGTVHGNILMNEEPVAMFVTTAKDLGLDQEMFNSLRIYETETEAVTVRVGAKPGVLPADAELRVTELEEEGEHAEAYQEAKEALDKEGMQYEQMMALDISFYDHDGNEIEPDGDVRVSIKLNPEKIPEEVLPETMSVQHLQEEKNGEVQVIQVADTEDKTKGSVAVNDEETIAEFDVESFSTFTITWSGDNGHKDGKTTFKLNLGYLYADPETDRENTGKISNRVIKKLPEAIENENLNLDFDNVAGSISNKNDRRILFNSEFASAHKNYLRTDYQDYEFIGAYYIPESVREKENWNLNELKSVEYVYRNSNQDQLKWKNKATGEYVSFTSKDIQKEDSSYVYSNIYLLYAPRTNVGSAFSIKSSKFDPQELKPEENYVGEISVYYLYADGNELTIFNSTNAQSLLGVSIAQRDNVILKNREDSFEQWEDTENQRLLKEKGFEYRGAYYGCKVDGEDWNLKEIRRVFVNDGRAYLRYNEKKEEDSKDHICKSENSIYLVYTKLNQNSQDSVYNIRGPEFISSSTRTDTIGVYYLYVSDSKEGIIDKTSSDYPEALKEIEKRDREDKLLTEYGKEYAFKELETEDNKNFLQNQEPALKYIGAYYGYKPDNGNWDLTEIDGVYVSSGSSPCLKYALGTSEEGELRKGGNIYLVYADPIEEISGSGGSGSGNIPGEQTKDIWRSKTAMRKDDGTYELNLSINVPEQEKINSQLDVLFVVDTSSSMTTDTTLRVDIAKKAMSGLINEFKNEDNKDISIRYSMVTFNRVSNTNTSDEPDRAKVFDWGSNPDDILNYLTKENCHSGTNYQAGIREAKKQLVKSTRFKDNDGKDRNARSIVIFLTDGTPTSYGDGSVGIITTTDICLRQAEREIEDLKCSELYFIGCGGSQRNSLNSLWNHAGNVSSRGNSSNYVFESTDEDLNTTFKKVGERIKSTIRYKGVTVTDPLSMYAEEVISNSNGTDSVQLNIEVTDVSGKRENGETGNVVVNAESQGKPEGTKVLISKSEERVTGAIFEKIVSFTDETYSGGNPRGTVEITAQYNKENHTLSMMFPQNYYLNPTYAYTISMQIKPTEYAHQQYAKQGYLDDGTGKIWSGDGKDDYTGTHTMQEGFPSNAKAVVKAGCEITSGDNVVSEAVELEFKHPVIQLDMADISIEKIVKQGEILNVDPGQVKFILSSMEIKEENGETVFKEKSVPENIAPSVTPETWEKDGIDTKGVFAWKNLKAGYYLLHEDQPAGYKEPSDYIIHIDYENLVDEDNASGEKNSHWHITMKYCEAKFVQEHNGWIVDKTESEWIKGEGKTFTFSITNTPETTTVLPDTGGPGLAMFERFGWFLLMMALMMAGMEVRFYGERKNRKAVLAQQEEPEYGDDW